MLTVAIIVLLFSAAVVLFWSFTICAPKWYRLRVKPTKVGKFLHTVRPKLADYKPLQYLVLFLASPILLLFAFLTIWVDAIRIIIHRSCPYTYGSIPRHDSPFLMLVDTVKGWMSKEAP